MHLYISHNVSELIHSFSSIFFFVMIFDEAVLSTPFPVDSWCDWGNTKTQTISVSGNWIGFALVRYRKEKYATFPYLTLHIL